MAHNGTQLDQETFSCSICLDLLKDPVTIPCGHNYCMNCIKSHWDEEDEKKIHSCPQCRQTFTPRPVLVKNVILATLVEELEKTKKRVQSAPADHCYAGPEDVACDVCTGRKLKALKSCLVCMVSYCQQHLQPHFESPAFAKHKLVDPLKKLQENICCGHNEVMNMFCNTDKRCICYLCPKDDHKGHDTFSVVTGSTKRQRELNKSRQKVQQKIRSKEKKIKALQQKVEVINGSANKSFKDSEKIFSELINLIRKKSSHVKQQIRAKQKIEVGRIKMLQEIMEQEITDLKKKDAGLEQLSHIEDHTEFLHMYPSLSQLAETPDLPSVDVHRLTYFADVTTAVSEVRDELEDTLREKWTNIPLIEPEPKTRAEFLKHSCEITLDPNAANRFMYVDEGERKIRMLERPQCPPSHPDRFVYCGQVLSRETLPERCYWEVEFSDRCHIAVAYKNIRRDRPPGETSFGYNDKSWALTCDKFGNMYMHSKVSIFLSGPQSYRVGVYLDHSAGILSFYSISETMTLLHRVQTTFTQPLYAGLGLDFCSSFTAELCELK